jgi:hypothetical protein
MDLQSESANTKFSVFEAEMRRRLWWSLLLFDDRVCELARNKTTMLTPTWDCSMPLNVNDCDLSPDMTNPPSAQEKPSEAVFAVVRSEIADFTRHSTMFLDFVNPVLKVVATNVHDGQIPQEGGVAALRAMIEQRYLRLCNPESSLHLMTIWMARGFLAKGQLLEHYSKFLSRRCNRRTSNGTLPFPTLWTCSTVIRSS